MVVQPLCFQWFPALWLCGFVGAVRHLRGGIGARCGRCATVPCCALCGASPCPVRCVPGCGWVSAPLHRLRGCVGFCGGCGGAFLIQWYLRPPCAPVVRCGGSVCPLRGSDGVPCPAPPLRTICRPAWPVVRPVALVGSVCGVGWVSASPPPIAPPVPSCALSQRPTLPPWLCPALLFPCAIFTTSGGIGQRSPLCGHLSVIRAHLSTTHAHISLTAYVFIPHHDLCISIHSANKNISV